MKNSRQFFCVCPRRKMESTELHLNRRLTLKAENYCRKKSTFPEIFPSFSLLITYNNKENYLNVTKARKLMIKNKWKQIFWSGILHATDTTTVISLIRRKKYEKTIWRKLKTAKNIFIVVLRKNCSTNYEKNAMKSFDLKNSQLKYF